MKLKLWKLKMLLKGIHTVDIAPKSLLIYKLKVNGNAQKSDFEAIKKLNRCWLSGTHVAESDRIEIRYYGNLKMMLDKNINTIIFIQNNHGKAIYEVNQNLKEKYNKLLEI